MYYVGEKMNDGASPSSWAITTSQGIILIDTMFENSMQDEILGRLGRTAFARGLDARRLATAQPPVSVETLARTIEDDGGSALAIYRDPLGSHWQILAALPIGAVEPTPFQRDLSEAHVGRVAKAIDTLDRYLDPVIAVPAGGGKYWSPNGYHRLGAMRELGAKSIVALVVPEPEVAHRILLLNTEKAHNLRERALEVARLAEALAALDDRPEREFAIEFEEAALVTLGLCYQVNGRFSGGVYHPVLKRCDKFLASKLSNAPSSRLPRRMVTSASTARPGSRRPRTLRRLHRGPFAG